MQGSFIKEIYPELRFWFSVGGAFWVVFKAFSWIKAIRENDLTHIQTSVNDLKSGLDHQTTSIVQELQGLRGEFRTYFMTGRAKKR